MSYNVETMGVEHVTVQIAEPDTLIGEDYTRGWALVLNGDNVAVIEGFRDQRHLSQWLIGQAARITTGDMPIAEGDDE